VTEAKRQSGRDWLTWKVALSAAPVGVGVGVFLAVRWPWDLLAIVALLVLAAIVSRFASEPYPAAIQNTLLLYAFVFVVLFTALEGYAVIALPQQQWLPVPFVVGFGVLAAFLGTALVIPLGMRIATTSNRGM